MIRSLLVAASFFGANLADAQEYSSAYTIGAADASKGTWNMPKPSVEVGGLLYHFDYVETLQTPFRSTERGTLSGIRISYSDTLDLGGSLQWLFRASADVTESRVAYDGSLQDGTPSSGYSGLGMVNARLTYGPRFLLKSAFSVNPYLGLGVRNWRRTLNSPDLSSYIENYFSLFVPAGTEVSFFMSDQFQISLDATLHIPILTRFTVNLGSSRSNSLQTDFGLRLAMPLTLWATARVRVRVAPYYETIGFRESFKGNGIYEPSSRTYQWGAEVGAVVEL